MRTVTSNEARLGSARVKTSLPSVTNRFAGRMRDKHKAAQPRPLTENNPLLLTQETFHARLETHTRRSSNFVRTVATSAIAALSAALSGRAGSAGIALGLADHAATRLDHRRRGTD